MATNFLNPLWAIMTYTGVTRPHHATFKFAPSGTVEPGAMPNVLPKVGAPIALDDGLATFISVWSHIFGASVGFGLVQVFYAPTPADPPLFITAFDLGMNGTAGVDAPVQFGQATFSFKTYGGGELKLVGLESVLLVNRKVRDVADLITAESNIVNHMLSDENVVYARDNTPALAWQSLSVKTNDTLLKKGVG